MNKDKKSEYNRRYREKQKELSKEKEEQPEEPVEAQQSLTITEDDYKEFLTWKESKKKVHIPHATGSLNFASLLVPLLPIVVGIIQRSLTLPPSGEPSQPQQEEHTTSLESIFA